ncbi:GH3 auxin-responsive promoter family protein [Opitutales bacterium ASA1]|uniref:GH3 family domain-containing protein n=1 Tax=Congregicoccus parvus TaxID=3081749 RepID=UPI002B3261EF|nr:GH3 auxin-responsive promoter family protein [Opitutales bacterium ASA1]
MSTLVYGALRVGARAFGSSTRRRMKAKSAPRGRGEKTLRRLLRAFARTRFGRDHGLEPQMPIHAWKDEVPLCSYEDLVTYIDRMKHGEPDQLWPGLCRFFAVSSGTTAGPSKYLPVTDALLAHFRKAGLASLLFYTARTGRNGIFGGRHLFLGGATRLQRVTVDAGEPIFAGDLSGITATHLPWWVDSWLYEPGQEIAQMEDWPRKIEAIVARTRSRDIRMAAGIPSWLLVLFERLRADHRASGRSWCDIRSVWPAFECLVHGGVPVEPYVEQLRSFVGDAEFHEVFPASEGFLAAQDGASGEGLRLLDDAGIYFEFLPVEALDAEGRALPGAVTIPADACEVGRVYALVLTTPGGLCRYVIGDLVRIVSADPPRLLYAGRTRLQASAFGEHVIEHELTCAVSAACRAQRVDLAHFHVAPLFADPAAGRLRGRHEWWIELVPGREIDRCAFADVLEAELQRLNDDYAAKRRGMGMDSPVVRLVPAGTFRAWLEARGKWGGQNKVPRCRSDRAVADELAELFACTVRRTGVYDRARAHENES